MLVHMVVQCLAFRAGEMTWDLGRTKNHGGEDGRSLFKQWDPMVDA